MCHVTTLSDLNRRRLLDMPREYRQKLEHRLEYGPYTPSTREAVTPIFMEVYTAWQELEAARKAAMAVTADFSRIEAQDAAIAALASKVIPVYVGGEKVTFFVEDKG